MADMIALRTAAIDTAVRDAIAGGAKQLVILGAGYDGRAWRMPELAGVKSLRGRSSGHAGRQARAPGRAASGRRQSSPSSRSTSSASRSTPCSSAPDTIASSPTCWIWEGVVMYLTRDAMRATLASHRRQERARLDADRELPHRFIAGFIARSDLPLDRRAADQRLDARGDGRRPAIRRAFVVREDSGMADWNTRFARGEAKVERGFLHANRDRKQVSRWPGGARSDAVSSCRRWCLPSFAIVVGLKWIHI